MACHYIPLYNIITYYVTIMTLIAIMAINTLLCHIYDYFQKAKSAFSEQKNAGMGNTPRVSCWRRIPAAWSPRSVNDMDLWFLGSASAHGVPNNELCLWWMSMACRESNSFLQWAHLKPNDMGNLFGPSGFPLPAPLPAPRRMLWLDFNLLQISVSGPIDANGSETGTKHNTKRSIRTTLCIAIDGSVDWTCTDYITIWMKNNQNVRRMTLKLMRVMQSKLQNAMWRIAHRATPAQNVMHAHAQCKS